MKGEKILKFLLQGEKILVLREKFMKEFGLIRNSKAEGLQSSILRALEETKAIQYRDVEDGGDEIFEVCSLVFWFGLKFFDLVSDCAGVSKKISDQRNNIPS